MYICIEIYTSQKLLGHWTDEKKHGNQTFELTLQWNYDAIHFFSFPTMQSSRGTNGMVLLKA